MPYPVKAKSYTWIVFLILTVLTGFDLFPLLFGILIGYLCCFTPFSYCYSLSTPCAFSCEKNSLFAALADVYSFVSTESADEYSISNGDDLPKYNRIDHAVPMQVTNLNNS